MSKTFREAAESYLENGGSQRYLQPVIEYFGETKLTEIFPYDIKKMAEKIYPGHSNSSKNRMAITPARAVIMHGYERGWNNYIRISRFKEDRPKKKKPASQVWLATFVRQCDKECLYHIGALVLFMASTGARVSEAIRVKWDDVDLISKSVILKRTKTETNSIRYLTDELTRRLSFLKDRPRSNDRVFKLTSRYSVNERINAVCKRAGITYKSSHACGRHSFATNAIMMGADVRSVMEAGGWKSSSIFLDTYVNPRNAGRAVAERFNLANYDNEV